MKKLFVTLLFAGFVSFIPSSLHLSITSTLSAQIPSDGLVAWYPFNGNANDESGNGNHGVVNGATLTVDRFGNANSAYFFDGISHYIGLQGTQIIDFSDGISFSAWIKADEIRMGSIIDKEEYCNSQGYRINVRDDSEIWAEHSCYGGQVTGANTAKATSAYSVGEWCHVVGSLSLTEGNKIYINGVLIQNVPVGISVNNNKVIEIGKSTLVQGEYFKGLIDDAAVYNRTLSLTEIQQLYQDQTGQVQQPLTCNITAPNTTLCEGESVTLSVNTTGGASASSQLPANLQQGLVAYYPFNGNANDESGNGNDGVVFGAQLATDRMGMINRAYYFNGAGDYIKSSSTGFPNNNRTINLWMFPESSEARIVCGYGGSGICGDSYLLNLKMISCDGPGKITMQSHCCVNVSSADYSYIVANQWNMLTYLQDTDGIKWFINGNQVYAQPSNFNTFVSQSSDFGIGTAVNYSGIAPFFDGNANPFHGWLDDIFVYNRALSPSEIQQLYNSQSYTWSTNATTTTITVTPTQNTTYSCTVTQGNQTCTANVDITVNPNVTNSISATIIEGETYTLGTQTLTTSGIYTEVFTSVAGCDSMVTLTLIVEPALTCEITAPTTTLCEGESVTLSVNTTGGAGASSQLPANLQQGLVAYYPFNGNANDESGNGNNGTVNGATLTSDRFGNAQSAFSFDGLDDFINCGIWNLGPSAFTISAWLNETEVDSSPSFVVSKFDGISLPFPDNNILRSWILYRHSSNEANSFVFEMSQDGVLTDNLYFNEIGHVNVWKNIALTFNQGEVRCYVNGVIDTTFSIPFSTVFQSDVPVFIGISAKDYFPEPMSDAWFSGEIDDLVFHNRALTSSEIQQLYTAQSYAWSTNATTPTITVSPLQNTTYSCTVTQGNQTCTASVDITVNPNVTNAISATIIEGETYTLGTQTLTTAGTYTEVFTSGAGCDSTVTLTLSVEPALTCEITAPTTTLCEGESVTLSLNTTGGAGASSQLPANLQQGLVAYYPFNGNANDESGNGYDGVVNGANLIADRFGNLNCAYGFNSSNILANIPNSTFQSDFTISAWVSLDQQSSQINYPTFITQENSYLTMQFEIWPIGAEPHFNCYFLNYYNIGGLQTEDGHVSAPVAYNSWTKVTLCNSSGINYLYINGILVDVSNQSSLVQGLGAGNYLLFGSGDLLPVEKFIGQLDDIAIYNRALSPSEIQQLYTAQSYAWSNNATTPTITVTPTASTTYSCTVTQGNSTCTASVDITVSPLLTWYADSDADGFGNPDDVVQDCNQPQGYIADNTDCNDEDAATYPGAAEICDNNRDENCDGVDSLCFVAILGCTDVNACNFNPEANTDDNSCILPQPETCNGLDDNCNGQVDEGFTIPSINATSATPALYPTCTGNALKSANLLTGMDSPVIAGSGPDLWYSFTAQYNTLRVGLSAAFGDNSIGLYTNNNGCMELISEEHEVYTATTAATGNQILLTDQLTVGQT